MRRLLLIFLFLAYTFCRAGTADSLLNLLKSPLADTQRVDVLNALCYDYYVNDVNKAIPFGREALALATSIKYKMGMAQAYLTISYALKTLGHHQAAIVCADSGLVITEAYNLVKPKIKLYNQLGNIYGDLGDNSKSLSYYLKAVATGEATDNLKLIAGCYANIGVCFMYSKQYQKAKEYLYKALAAFKKHDDLRSQGNAYDNLGAVYLDENMLDSAIIYFNLASEVYKAIKYERGRGFSAYYLGYTYKEKKEYDKSLTFFKQAAEHYEKSGSYSEIPNILICISDIYLKKKETDLALDYARQSLAKAVEFNAAPDKKEAYLVLKEIYYEKGDYKTAIDYYTRFTELKDSLFNSESTAQMAEMQTKYETEKKEKENKLLQEKNESNTKTIRQQRYFAIAVGFICVLLVAFAIVIFRSNKQKQRVNLELEKKNATIQKQKQLVEEKQKEILDSIHYAKRIQGSLLTSEIYIARTLKRVINSGSSSES